MTINVISTLSAKAEMIATTIVYILPNLEVDPLLWSILLLEEVSYLFQRECLYPSFSQ